VAAALQIWSPTFSKAFDSLPATVRDSIQRAVDEMGSRFLNFPHQRLQGRPEFKLRVGDYRVLHEFDVKQGRIYFALRRPPTRHLQAAQVVSLLCSKAIPKLISPLHQRKY
jgi:mRNA-degrading endonuclease RelE of RelBE toxin-antitoxin system